MICPSPRWSNGPPVPLSVGPSVLRSVSPFVLRSVGSSFRKFDGPSVRRFVGPSIESRFTFHTYSCFLSKFDLDLQINKSLEIASLQPLQVLR